MTSPASTPSIAACAADRIPDGMNLSRFDLPIPEA